MCNLRRHDTQHPIAVGVWVVIIVEVTQGGFVDLCERDVSVDVTVERVPQGDNLAVRNMTHVVPIQTT